MRPQILILDEPTAGLDPGGRDEILGSVARIQKETGSSVVLVSHSMDDVAEYVKRIVVIDKGRIAFDDKPVRVFSHIEELESMGLSAPQITYVMHELRKAGFDADTNALTIKEAADSILSCLNIKIHGSAD